MSNTITNLIPDIYAALDVVSRELVGFIPAVARDPSVDRVAIGQTVRVPQAPANTGGTSLTPAMAMPTAAYQTIGYKSITIDSQYFWPFSWTGAEQKALNAGPGYLTIQQSQIAQAMRAAVNTIEAAIALAAVNAASRAYGTAATTPFGTAGDMTDLAQLLKILKDNGAPISDLHLPLSTAAAANLRAKQSIQLSWANNASVAEIQTGALGKLESFNLHESAGYVSHTAGTGAASYQVNGAHAAGVTSILLKTGSGTILAGDSITIGTDTNKYVVTTGITSPGTIVIAAPGLLVAKSGNEYVTLSAAYTPNVGFNRNAIVLATRLPDLPVEGDYATDHLVVTDPVSGLSFDFASYGGFYMNTYTCAIAWGIKVIKPEHVATLLG
jgi:hypothetical protein